MEKEKTPNRMQELVDLYSVAIRKRLWGSRVVYLEGGCTQASLNVLCSEFEKFCEAVNVFRVHPDIVFRQAIEIACGLITIAEMSCENGIKKENLQKYLDRKHFGSLQLVEK